jgi:branched-chain amino acid transport system ATP-binding protein
MLAIENLTASYAALSAISDISFTLATWARVGIFGHNGAGKTTLLKCVVGAHAPNRGRVVYDGVPIVAGNIAATVLRGIAFVPQGHNVFPNLSVEQNLKIAGLLFDASFVAQVYDLFPVLKGRGSQRAGSMSGGEQQMLALGMALMTKPKWLLLDEPCTGLAPIIIETVIKRLSDVNVRYGTGLCIVEQNVPATLKLVDRAIILKSGRVVFDGSARELEVQKDLWQWF